MHVDVRDFGAKGDGLTNDYGAVADALAAIPQEQGGTLYFPNGEYVLDSGSTAPCISVKHSNLTILGEDRRLTRIRRKGIPNQIIRSGATLDGRRGLIVESLTLDWWAPSGDRSVRATIEIYGSHLQDVKVFDCLFRNMAKAGWGIYTYHLNDLAIDGCEFISPGDSTGSAIVVSRSSRNVRIHNNKFRWVRDAIQFVGGSGPGADNENVSNIIVSENDIDLFWMHNTAQFSGLPTAPYTSTKLFDDTVDFTQLGLSVGGEGAQYVRVHDVVYHGVAASYGTRTLSDVGKDFQVWPDWFVLAGNAYAIVSHARNEDVSVLEIEGWLSRQDRRPVPPPPSNTPYHIVRPLLGRLVGIEGLHTLVVNKWVNLNGRRVTPPVDAVYEVLNPHANYAIQGGSAVHGVQVVNNRCVRGYSDQIAPFGSCWQIIGNRVVRGQTAGVALDGGFGHIVKGNNVHRNGGGGIALLGADYCNVSGNICLTNGWLNAGGNPELYGDVWLANSNRNIITGNQVLRVGDVADNCCWGVSVFGQSSDNFIHSNISRGHQCGGFVLHTEGQHCQSNLSFDEPLPES